jgi:nicotinate phosphoribosyltransferase
MNSKFNIMDNEPGIIKSLLDNDLYKLTMQNAVCKLFPRVNVRYEFFNRGKTPFPKGFDKKLRKEIEKMANLRLTREQKNFLRAKCGRYMDDVYIDFLSSYQFDPSEVGVIMEEDGGLRVIVEGPWYRTILWEVPLMALISELYFIETGQKPHDRNTREKTNCAKGMFFYGHNMKVTDFGTRRRFSYDNQFELCKDMKGIFGSNKFFMGTSNVHIAMELDLTPIGTHAHEWFMFMAARYGYKMANRMALEHWVDVYQGDLGTALTDTYTTDIFLQSFDRKYSKLFDGPRHDSGEPTEWLDKFVKHYQNFGIKPSTKTAVFSNNLNTDEAYRIQEHANKHGDGINIAFGIGTNFTNDVGVKPLNIVIKMVSAQAVPGSDEWVDTVKLSDDEGKHTGHGDSVEIAQKTLGIYKKKELETA